MIDTIKYERELEQNIISVLSNVLENDEVLGTTPVNNVICDDDPTSALPAFSLINFDRCTDLKSLIETQAGSRMLQSYISQRPSNDVRNIFKEIKPHIADLLLNQFGNYFCHHLYSCLQIEDRLDYLCAISQKIFKIAFDSVGRYPLQVILSSFIDRKEKSIIRNLMSVNKEEVAKMCLNSNAANVLDLLLSEEILNEETVIYIYDHIIDHFIELIAKKCGVVVIKRFISLHFPHDNTIRNLILQNFASLLHNQNGINLLEFVLQVWKPNYLEPVYKKLIGKLAKLSMGTCTAKIVEIAMTMSESIVNGFQTELINSNNFISFIENSNSNALIQKSFQISTNVYLAYTLAKKILSQVPPKGCMKGTASSYENWKSLCFMSQLVMMKINMNSKAGNGIQYGNINNLYENNSWNNFPLQTSCGNM